MHLYAKLSPTPNLYEAFAQRHPLYSYMTTPVISESSSLGCAASVTWILRSRAVGVGWMLVTGVAPVRRASDAQSTVVRGGNVGLRDTALRVVVRVENVVGAAAATPAVLRGIFDSGRVVGSLDMVNRSTLCLRTVSLLGAHSMANNSRRCGRILRGIAAAVLSVMYPAHHRRDDERHQDSDEYRCEKPD